uniref:Uncharacterized protein n=1 Tax=Avena sativa TaxID=4498 RepID=A0ACD5UGQ7_AVESA
MASPANSQATRGSPVALQYTKIDLSKLYLRQVFSGSATNQSGVIDANTATGLGQAAVNNWAIYDGIGSDAKLVAHAQGMHIFAGNWHNWFTIVFEDGRFKGSTLQIMGSSFGESNQWAIVGGTGEFTMAQGVIQRKNLDNTGDKQIQELTTDGYCLWKVPTPTKMGPWGAEGAFGYPYEMAGKSKRLESVTISHFQIIETLSFSYANEDGHIRTAGPWGYIGRETNHKPIFTTIKFGPSEFVKGLSGSGNSTKRVISCFKIITNVATYGPFGTGPNHVPSFSATVPDDKTVVGLFVHSYNNDFLTQIGVYTI